jgi:predicted NUDIX family NTP pyrophosphohydrolase
MVISAGLLIYRKTPENCIEVLLVHPGGPFFAKKDKGFWTIPKGLPEPGEHLLNAAKREFEEETGYKIPGPVKEFTDLGTVRQKSGKTVQAFATEMNLPQNWTHKSNNFTLEWPPKSGKMKEFPEMDKAQYFEIETAKEYINEAQHKFLERLADLLQV